MKKYITLLLAAALIFCLTACGLDGSDDMEGGRIPGNGQPNTSSAGNKDSSDAEGNPAGTQGNPEGLGSRILIAYFSVPEDVETVDAVAGASIVVTDGEKLGNTEYVAKLVWQTVGGDLFRIETVEPYPLEHNPLVDYAADEQDEGARPELKNQVENFEQYETVILGFPNWWADLPMPVYTFLEEYDFGTKTVIPFVTHGGSGFSGTLRTIAKLLPDASVSDNTLSLSRNSVADARETVISWAESLGIYDAGEEEGNAEDMSGMAGEENAGDLDGAAGKEPGKAAEEKSENTGDTVATAAADPKNSQVLYLWEEGNMPAKTQYTQNNGNYADDPDFRPYVVTFPVPESTPVKGAVLINAGGAFQFRSDQMEGTPVAEELSKLGYQSFVVNYRLRPYTQEEGALDLARAVRFVRKHAEVYGIDEEDIAVMGFSAGGILAGEMLLNFDGTVNGTALDADYVPDELDEISADAGADGMIYSFYGRLSVASDDVEKFAASDLPPTYFCYGTRDPFVRQFEKCIAALKKAGVVVASDVLEGQPHGYGYTQGWIPAYDEWLAGIFANNSIQGR